MERKELENLFIEAVEHLEYCGYGDEWERECAQESKLPDRLGAAVEEIENSREKKGSR